MRSWPLLLLFALLVGQAAAFAVLDWETVRETLFAMSRALGVPFTTMVVFAGTSLLGVAAGVIGTFAVLRGRSLVGDAVAHAALPGLAIAFIVAGYQKDFAGMLVGAGVAGLLGAFVIAFLTRHTRTKSDAAIGIVLSVFFGLGITLTRIIQNTPTGRAAGLDNYLLGSTGGMIAADLLVIALLALNLVVLVVLFYKEFMVVTFDPEYAASLGWPAGWIDALLLALIVAATVIGLPAVGVVLIAAMLILPGVTASFFSERLPVVLLLAAGFGLLTGATGTWLSAEPSALPLVGELGVDLPAGPIIVLTGASFFFLAALFAPRRGILARIRHVRLDWRRFEQTKLLHSLYEHAGEDGREAVAFRTLLPLRSWTERSLPRLLRTARRLGYVERVPHQEGESWQLTATGREQAARIVLAERVWDLILTGAVVGLASPEEIDRESVDLAARLRPEALDALERLLRDEDRWPEPAPSFTTTES